MKVLQINKFYHPVVGGIEHVVRQLAEGLPDHGADTKVLVARERGRGTTETVNGVPVTRASSLGVALSTPLSPTFPLHLRKLSSSADVLHYHLPNPLAVLGHELVRPATPTVVTYHSDIVRQARALRLYRPFLHRFLGDADRIVTTSPRLRERSDHLAPYREKTDVVPLSVNLERIDSADTSPPKPTAADVPTVLFVGRLNYYKGVSYLIEAMARIRTPAELVVVGDGERRDALEELTRSLEVADRVRFLGRVDDERLHGCYRDASVFVLPSVESSEAFGIVQLEAMAHGLPVINTSLPTGVPWVSLDGETGLTVPPRDEDELAGALEELLSNPDLRAKYGEAARRRVESRFTERRMLADTIDLYEDLV